MPIWKEKIGEEVDLLNVPKTELKEYLMQNIEVFKGEGGIILFMYAAVINKGVDSIKKEIASA